MFKNKGKCLKTMEKGDGPGIQDKGHPTEFFKNKREIEMK